MVSFFYRFFLLKFNRSTCALRCLCCFRDRISGGNVLILEGFLGIYFGFIVYTFLLGILCFIVLFKGLFELTVNKGC